MKASEMAMQLIDLIATHGDKEIEVEIKWKEKEPTTLAQNETLSSDDVDKIEKDHGWFVIRMS